MKHNYCAVHKSISIRPLHRCDIEQLRLWRNKRDLAHFLNPIPEITKEAQIKWYERYLDDEDCVFFAIIDIEKNKMIGTIALYDFDKGSAKIGRILIGDETERGKGIGYKSLLLAARVGFREFSIDNYFLTVFEDNLIACKLYEKVGFARTGSHRYKGTDRIELVMKITKDEFMEKNAIMDEIKIYRESEKDAEFLECGI